ncbi:PAS domain S-box protein [Undibacterium sp. SXout7W]|uniref:PAS domain S-box protein n=1 Tax=Undibacterium sp. SXout7W TaxID=3413049 RepID=UPI003BF16DBE
MQTPAFPQDELRRMIELCSLHILDTPAEERFERITRSAKHMFDVPIVAISLIDHDRQWFKSRHGLDVSETGRDISFCGHAILGDEPFVIEDTLKDERFFDNPLVLNAPFIRFYAGVPVHGQHGYRVGTLCLIDSVSRQLNDRDLAALRDLAAMAEAELQASTFLQTSINTKSQLNSILGQITDGVVVIAPDGIMKTVNDAVLHLFGYPKDALIDQHLSFLIPEFQHKQIQKTTNQGIELTAHRADGSSFQLTLTIDEVTIDRQRYFTAVIHETSQQRNVEKKLKEVSSLLQTVLDGTGSYVHVRDVDGHYLYVNKEYEKVFQCSADDILGKHFKEVLPPGLIQHVQDYEYRLSKHKKEFQTELVVQRPDGEHIYLVSHSVIYDENGILTGTSGVGIDITKLKTLELEREQTLADLRTSEERWLFALEGSGEGVWDWDIVENKVQYSKRWKEMLGYQVDEISDAVEEWSSRVHPDDREMVMAAVTENMAGHTKSFMNEHRFLCKNGSYMWLLDRGMVVKRDAHGNPLRMVGTHSDISQRKKLEHIKNEFISTVSHELRTPLTSIKGSLGLLEAGILGELPSKALGMIKVAYKNSIRLSKLVNDILDMEKLMSGKLTLDLVPLDFVSQIKESIETNASYASIHHVRFRLLNEDPVFVIADENRLQQIFSNLLSNAAKFSRPNEFVNIRFSLEEQYVRVFIEDHGDGIPEEFTSRIFDAFSQANGADTRRHEGTGLGLNITKRLINQMGGDIGYFSEQGAGATFWFTLPLHQA